MTDISQYIDVEQLQALRQKPTRAPRQQQRVVWLDGYKFNLTEAHRYNELKTEVYAGLIAFLTVHPPLVIQRKGQDAHGNVFKRRVYTPDFIYRNTADGQWVAEEVKATRYTKTGKARPVTNETFGYRWDMARARYRRIAFRIMLG
jgi:hypothetical protein